MTETEFTEIVEATKGTVLSAVERHLFTRFYHAIDDVVQETYIRAYRNLSSGKFRGDSTVHSWLYTIARNESLRMNRKLSREEEKFTKSLEHSATGKGTADIDFDETIYVLHESIAKLPDTYRTVLELAARGFSEKEIALKLSLKQGTVKSRASRGREMLQKLLPEGNYG